jgi:predicted flavoprotein YhiN
MIIAVIGAGPAGLMASVRAAECGSSRVLLFEKNASPGRKLLMTGNGRCNVSNSADIRMYPENYFGNGKFLYKALHALSPSDLRDFFASRGCGLRKRTAAVCFPSAIRHETF